MVGHDIKNARNEFEIYMTVIKTKKIRVEIVSSLSVLALLSLVIAFDFVVLTALICHTGASWKDRKSTRLNSSHT